MFHFLVSVSYSWCHDNGSFSEQGYHAVNTLLLNTIDLCIPLYTEYRVHWISVSKFNSNYILVHFIVILSFIKFEPYIDIKDDRLMNIETINLDPKCQIYALIIIKSMVVNPL